MTNLWVDANVLLRLITNEPPDLAERFPRLTERAEQGETHFAFHLLSSLKSSGCSTRFTNTPVLKLLKS